MSSIPLWVAILVILGGIFSVVGSVLDWDFFFNNRRARLIVAVLSRDGARIFYVLLGLLLIFVGVARVLNVPLPFGTGA